MTAPEPDANGRFHGDDGRYIQLRDYVERIFDEKDKSSEFQRVTLERALVEARATAERAMQEAKSTTDAARESDRKAVEQRLIEAKSAADGVSEVITKRLELLESGGAPFASRLDESLTALKSDVDVLKENMVRTTVLDALREQSSADLASVKKQAEADRKSLKRQVLLVAATSAVAVILAVVQLLVHHP